MSTCNLSTWKTGVGGFGVPGQSRICIKFKVNRGNVTKYCLKKTNEKGKKKQDPRASEELSRPRLLTVPCAVFSVPRLWPGPADC